MASSVDYQWVECVPDELVCAICLEVATDPCQHGGEAGCGRVFCKACITRDQRERRGQSCPTCRQRLSVFHDPKSARQIRALKVKCAHVESGCVWVGEMGELADHLPSCEYVLVPCTNECTVNSEPCKVLKKDLADHLDNECPKRISQCPYCSKRMKYLEIASHLGNCTTKQVKCPNAKCGYWGSRSSMEDHREICAYECVPCRYAQLGCQEKPRRREVKKHEEDDQRRLRVPLDQVLQLMGRVKALEENLLTSTTITELEDRVHAMWSKNNTLLEKTVTLESRIVTLESGLSGLSSSLEQKLRALRLVTEDLQEQINMQGRDEPTPVAVETTPQAAAVAEATPTPKYAPCTFKMTDFQEHKRTGDVFHSPHFYTSPGGYKMSVGVCAVGRGDGWHTHVSVTIRSSEGNHDDALTWPLSGVLTLELLNQLEDKSHHKRVVSLSMSRGSDKSIPLFIPHADLERTAGVLWRSRYLQSDTLFFRVSVQVAHHKQWLECTL